MTPRGVMNTVAKEDVIGPLLLDELHKTGHSRFPVTDGDIDHIVGILHIRSLLTGPIPDPDHCQCQRYQHDPYRQALPI